MVATTKKNTLLPTAKAKILNEDNAKEELIRELFDSCSQKSFVNERISRKLNLLVIRKERMIVQGFESFNAEPRKIDVVQAKLCGVKPTLTVTAELCVIPKICSPISCQTIELAQATYEHIIGLGLSDTCSESSNLEVDVLIGGDYYCRFMTGKMVRGEDGPVALHTILGWVLGGLAEGSNSLTTTTMITNHVLKVGCY